MHQLSFDDVKAYILSDAQTYLQEWLPGGEVKGNEYVVRNPMRDDKSPGSFTINMRSGIWKDFGTEEKGGDLISLFAYLQNLEQNAARKELIKKYSLASPAKKPKVRVANTLADDGFELVLPIPKNAPPVPKKIMINGELLEPSKCYEYRDAESSTLCFIYRFETEKGKDIRPLTLWRDKAGKLAWKHKMIPDNRPLYNLELLVKYCEKPVLVVSGEKCVEAVKWSFSQKFNSESDWPLIPVTWAGGDNAIKKIDFRPLLNREIIYWPDNDKSCNAAMESIRSRYDGIMLNIEREEKEDGYDVADLVLENQENEKFDLAAYIRAALDKRNDTPPDLNVPAPYSIFPHKNKAGKNLDTKANIKALLNYYKMKIGYNIISKKMEYIIGNKKYRTIDSPNDFLCEVKSLCSLNGIVKADLKIYLSALGSENVLNPVLDWIQSKTNQAQSLPLLRFLKET